MINFPYDQNYNEININIEINFSFDQNLTLTEYFLSLETFQLLIHVILL
jgi:hypothetical protein